MTDAEYIERLHSQLPALYTKSLSQFAPMWTVIAEAVAVESKKQPRRAILDLASGSVAEPACTLAQRFSAVNVVASDNVPEICEQAAKQVHCLGLSGRVEVENIDLASLAALADQADAAAEAPAIDTVTCSLGLFMLPAEQQTSLLGGIRTLLSPGGCLIATVWDQMVLMEIGGRVLAKVLGRDPEDSPPMPFAPTSLGNGEADALLTQAGFDSWGESHNQVHSLRLDLGPSGADSTWMLGLLPYTGTLVALHQQHGVSDVFERARLAFEVEMEAAGHVDETGFVSISTGLEYRVLSAIK